MVLRLEDITVFVANWDDKAANIRRIREMLNIGLDSMVFIDDNPFERELVRKLLPEVTVPEMPEDVSCFCSYLRSLDLFESAAISETDANRTEQYRSEFQRNQLMTNTTDLDSYLQSLEMKATYHSFDEQSYARIAQLTQRSNQFHLRSIRYSESDIEQIAKNDNYLTLYFTLKDQFGGYGIVAVVILEKQVLSCFETGHGGIFVQYHRRNRSERRLCVHRSRISPHTKKSNGSGFVSTLWIPRNLRWEISPAV